jgi:hypothetical protein
MALQSPTSRARAMADGVGGRIMPGDWRSTLARAGLSAKGALYGALGLLAIQVARGQASTGRVTREGAVELVASQPFGQWLLVLFTIGLFCLAAWQAILAFTGDPVEGSETKDRVKYGVKAAIYTATAITALTMLTGGRQSGGSSEDQAAGILMGWPGGPWLVGLLGLAILAVAAQQLYGHAIKKKFMRRLSIGGGGDVGRNVERAGRAGYAARGIVLLVVGTFFLIAAIQHDPREAVGLSGALRVMSQQAWGQALLWFVAVGLFLYGCFCFAEAKYRRAT